MYPNGHHIIKFAKYRWKLTKKVIAGLLMVEPSKLSRFKPPDFDPIDLYDNLFDVENKDSAAYGDDKADIIDMMQSFLLREDCLHGAQFIQMNSKGMKYEKLIMALLKRTNEPSAGSISLSYKKMSSSQAMSPEQILINFKQAIVDYGIMELINRNPPVVDKKDLEKMNGFAHVIDDLTIGRRRENNAVSQQIIKLCHSLMMDSAGFELDMPVERVGKFDLNSMTHGIEMIERDSDVFEFDNNSLPNRVKSLGASLPEPVKPQTKLHIDETVWDDFNQRTKSLLGEIIGSEDLPFE